MTNQQIKELEAAKFEAQISLLQKITLMTDSAPSNVAASKAESVNKLAEAYAWISSPDSDH